MVLTEEEKKANKKRDNANQYQKRLAKQKEKEEAARKKKERQLELGRARSKKSYQNKTMKNSNDNNGPPGTPAGAKTRPIAEGSPGMKLAEQSFAQLDWMVRSDKFEIEDINKYAKNRQGIIDSSLVLDRQESEREIVETQTGLVKTQTGLVKTQTGLEMSRGENLKTIAGMDSDGRDTVRALYKGNEDDRDGDGDKKLAAKPKAKKLSFYDVDEENIDDDGDDEEDEEEELYDNYSHIGSWSAAAASSSSSAAAAAASLSASQRSTTATAMPAAKKKVPPGKAPRWTTKPKLPKSPRSTAMAKTPAAKPKNDTGGWIMFKKGEYVSYKGRCEGLDGPWEARVEAAHYAMDEDGDDEPYYDINILDAPGSFTKKQTSHSYLSPLASSSPSPNKKKETMKSTTKPTKPCKSVKKTAKPATPARPTRSTRSTRSTRPSTSMSSETASAGKRPLDEDEDEPESPPTKKTKKKGPSKEQRARAKARADAASKPTRK